MRLLKNLKSERKSMEELKEYMTPELLNRIDYIFSISNLLAKIYFLSYPGKI
jgi:ATP-dependent Clp protease ATP-binding subunit ClpA